jgi:outer membrane protein assembly factor BamA
MLFVAALSATVSADDVRPEDARGWEHPPEESSGVVGTVVRGLGNGAGFLVDVVTWPFRAGIRLEDKYRAFSRARNFLYNEDHTAGVVPTLSSVSGFGSSIGFRAFHDNLLGNHEHVSLRASFGGRDRYSTEATFELPMLLGGLSYLATRGRYESADNLLFAGIGNAGDGGPLAPAGSSRYGERRWLGTLRAGVQHLTRISRLRVGGAYIYNDREFDADVTSSLDERYDTMALAGFTDGAKLHEASGELELDVYDRDAGRGARVAAFVGRGFGRDISSFTHWGAELTAYVTPWREGRVLLVRVAHEGVDHRDDMPFTELPRLGGPGLLRGYHRDQYRDDLGALATVEYRYPVHRIVSGSVFVEVGKVARTYDALATSGDWHAGYGGGLVLNGRNGPAFTLQLAYGDGLQLVATTDVLQAFRDRGGEL